jgi:hypothetical protein
MMALEQKLKYVAILKKMNLTKQLCQLSEKRGIPGFILDNTTGCHTPR